MTDWPALIGALSRTMRDTAPGWTDRNVADPGYIDWRADHLAAAGRDYRISLREEGSLRLIEERSHLVLRSASSDSGIVIARLVREQDRWCVDREFVPGGPR